MFYVNGLWDGAMLAKSLTFNAIKGPGKAPSAAETVALENEFSPFAGLAVSQEIDGLNAFYSDFRNRNIPVAWGLLLVAKSIKGMPQAEWDRLLEGYRRMNWASY